MRQKNAKNKNENKKHKNSSKSKPANVCGNRVKNEDNKRAHEIIIKNSCVTRITASGFADLLGEPPTKAE